MFHEAQVGMLAERRAITKEKPSDADQMNEWIHKGGRAFISEKSTKGIDNTSD